MTRLLIAGATGLVGSLCWNRCLPTGDRNPPPPPIADKLQNVVADFLAMR